MYSEPAGTTPAGADAHPGRGNQGLHPSRLPEHADQQPDSAPPEPLPGGWNPPWTHAELSGLRLASHHVLDVDLRGATMLRCRINKVDLSGRDLSRADLRGARGSGALLHEAILSHVDLAWADLREADLSGASLAGASLMEANLARADLRGADLRSTRHLELACLRGALADRRTQWPAGFDAGGLGVVFCDGPRRLRRPG